MSLSSLNHDRVFLLRQAIVKMTQVLTKSGIEVTQRGISAYVRCDKVTFKPVQVNLPYLPDDAPSELITAIQGFLDHEVAHVLETDFTVLKKINPRDPGAQRLHTLCNVFEDARIEIKMAERFRGSGSNLTTMGEFFLESIIKPMVNDLDAKGADEAAYIGALIAPAIRSECGQFLFKQFMEENEYWSKVPTLQAGLAKVSREIGAMNSTDGALNAARALVAAIAKPAALPKPPPTPSEEDEEEEEEEEKVPGKSKKAPKKEEKEEEKEEDEEEDEEETPATAVPSKDEDEEEEPAPASPSEEEGEEEAPAPSEEEGEEEAPAPSEEEGEEEAPAPTPAPSKDEGEEGEEDDTPPSDDSDGIPHEDDGSDRGVADASDGEGEINTDGDENAEVGCTDALTGLDEEGANNFDETLSRSISKTAAENASSATYIAYTTDFDRIEPLKVGKGYSPSMLKGLESKVEGMAGPMQKDLERAITARSHKQWEGGLRKGRLNVSALSRAATGDDRLFRQRRESDTKDVAVTLLIDASGSMSGSKIHTAAASAFALSQVLDRLKITHEVVCFTTGSTPEDVSKAITKEEKTHGVKFSRYEPLFMPVIKSFTERLTTDVKERFAWLPNANFFANNVDGECVLIAAQRLAVRKETGKCLIVLSDGSPACYGDMAAASKHLRTTVKRIEQAGVNVIGIGVESTDVTRYYAKNIVINDVTDLPNKVIGELRKHLLSK